MKKENTPIVIALALPVLLILAVAGFVYFSNNTDRPKNNFLYTTTMWPYAYSYSYGASSECTVYKNYYEIENGKLNKVAFKLTSNPKDMNYYPDGVFKPATAFMPPNAATYSAGTSTVDYLAAQYCNGYSRVVKKDAPELFLYESSKNAVRSISYEEVSKLQLEDGSISSEGYSIQMGYQNGSIFDIFGGSNYSNYYAAKGSKKVKIEIPEQDVYNRGNFGFIGWVKR